jgi:hypothetical protein
MSHEFSVHKRLLVYLFGPNYYHSEATASTVSLRTRTQAEATAPSHAKSGRLVTRKFASRVCCPQNSLYIEII